MIFLVKRLKDINDFACLDIEVIEKYKIMKGTDFYYVFQDSNKNNYSLNTHNPKSNHIQGTVIFSDEESLAEGIHNFMLHFTSYIKITGYDIIDKRPEFFI
jgi:CDP-glycerol glycerophosphotransferase (TagB/SpsB family)